MQVGAGRLEIGTGAVAGLVEMQAVPAWRQVADLKAKQQAARAFGEPGDADGLSGRSLDLDLDSWRRRQAGQGQCAEGGDDGKGPHGDISGQGARGRAGGVSSTVMITNSNTFRVDSTG